MEGKKVLLLAPGSSIGKYKDAVEEVANKDDVIVWAVNFNGGVFNVDYVFSSNMRRYRNIQGKTDAK